MDEEEFVPSVNQREVAVGPRDAFEDAIRELVVEAQAAGIDVRGEWAVDGPDGTVQWTVEISGPPRATYQVEDFDTPGETVVEAVARLDGVDATDLPSLYDAIDPDVLQALLGGNGDDQEVRFHYHGYRVTVHSDGRIRVRD